MNATREVTIRDNLGRKEIIRASGKNALSVSFAPAFIPKLNKSGLRTTKIRA
jgi:hypothetical protein